MEYWDLYDKSGNSIGLSVKRGDTFPADTYHRVIHVWIVNEKGEYLLQKRAPHLSWNPNKWSTTTGSVIQGETDFLKAAYREVEEELGLDNTKIDIEFENEIIIGNSIVSIFKAYVPSYIIQFIHTNEEVSDVTWAKKSKIELLREKEQFCPYSPETFEIVYNIQF